MGRDSVVDITTRYGLDGRQSNPGWGEISSPVPVGPGAYPASCVRDTGFFLAVKRPLRGVNHPHPTSAEVTERVGLYLYSPSGPSWPDLGLIFTKFKNIY
jgi:hypothetical protein